MPALRSASCRPPLSGCRAEREPEPRANEPRPRPRLVSVEEQAAVEVEVFGTKARAVNAEVGPRWLMDWCGRLLGSAGGADDTVPTAVCRMVLTGKASSSALSRLGEACLGSALRPKGAFAGGSGPGHVPTAHASAWYAANGSRVQLS